jgi:hypothetical protein
MYKQYDELLNKISESEVDKWTKIADRERKDTIIIIYSDLTDFPSPIEDRKRQR